MTLVSPLHIKDWRIQSTQCAEWDEAVSSEPRDKNQSLADMLRRIRLRGNPIVGSRNPPVRVVVRVQLAKKVGFEHRQLKIAYRHSDLVLFRIGFMNFDSRSQ